MTNKHKYYPLILGMFAFVLIFSCTPKKNMVYLEDKQTEEDAIAIAKTQYSGLRIQEGDIVEINVNAYDDLAVRPFNLSTMNRTGDDNMTTRTNYQGSEYQVDSEGMINFPTLGRIQVEGMTKQELIVNMRNRLKDYLKDPLVTVLLKNFNISVLGEVKSPGQVTSRTEKLNVFQALSLAGDMTLNGDRTKVKLIRSNEGEDEIVMLDLSDRRMINSPYYYLQQNDILYVEPDKNKQIAANSNPNRNLLFQVLGASIAVVSLIIAITR